MQKNNYIQRIKKLSPWQRELLASSLSFEKNDAQNSGHQRLVAFVTGEDGLDKNELTAWLKSQLPAYMVPSSIVKLEEIPRLPNGKVDLNSLPQTAAMPGQDEEGFTAPATPVEQKLAAIWEEVLHFQPIGIHDNFFEIGGDSILSIQIVARARKAGIHLKPTQIFEHQTIAQLALFAKTETDAGDAATEVAGPIPLLPIQRWFFEEHTAAPHHWNQGYVFPETPILDAGILEKAVKQLTLRHGALRSGFYVENGEWKAFVHPPGGLGHFKKINPGGQAMKTALHSLQSNLDLATDPLFQAVFFENETAGQGQLCLLAHHLVVDHVSWQIILDDLQTAYSDLKAGNEISWPANQVSIKNWGEHLTQLAADGAVGQQLGFWEKQTETGLPTDFEIRLPVQESNVQSIDFQLDKLTTAMLLNETAPAYHTKTDELLVAVLVKTLSDWTGQNSCCLGLERHGRETPEGAPDTSGLAGWLTVYFPLTFHLAKSPEIGGIIKSVKEQLRSVPDDGRGYGLLRYFKKEEKLRQRPAVIFNFLGQLQTPQARAFGRSEPLAEGVRDPRSERFHLFEVNAYVSENQLVVHWSFSEKAHRRETVLNLVADFENKLRQFIAHCRESGQGGYTPSDFPDAGLGQDDLDRLLSGF